MVLSFFMEAKMTTLFEFIFSVLLLCIHSHEAYNTFLKILSSDYVATFMQSLDTFIKWLSYFIK
jgi:hypothetical protein